MTRSYLPDKHIETAATRLLGGYEHKFGAITVPPVPVEDIADAYLDLRILWDTLSEPVGTSLLAGLSPGKRMIVFNESRREVIEDTQGLYNTVMGHEIGHWELHVEHSVGLQQRLPKLDQEYDCLFQEATSTQGPKEMQAHRFMGFLLMPSHLLSKAIRDIDLTSWKNLYELRQLFQVTISALRIRLERLGVLYVASDGQLYPSLQEYHGQKRMML